MKLARIQIITLVSLLTIALPCVADRINHAAMHKAYLEQDMSKWGEMLTKYKSLPNMTIDEQVAMCNYLYGYVATILDTEDKKVVKDWIKTWESYLDNLESNNVELSSVHSFRAAIAAYRTKIFPMNMLKYYKECINELEISLDLDPKNPVAVGLSGNVKFYLPKVMGGGKEAAINAFSVALPLFEKDLRPYQRWNYMGTWLCLAQAYEKTGNKNRAVVECKKILKVEPTNSYVRDVYLPALLSGKNIDKAILDF